MTLAVLVTGGRHYDDREAVFRRLDLWHIKYGIGILIHGGANGADSLAGEWAKENCVAILSVPADWEQYGITAGLKRNRDMLNQLLTQPKRVLIAFPGGDGTRHMSAAAIAAGVGVYTEPKPPDTLD